MASRGALKNDFASVLGAISSQGFKDLGKKTSREIGESFVDLEDPRIQQNLSRLEARHAAAADEDARKQQQVGEPQLAKGKQNRWWAPWGLALVFLTVVVPVTLWRKLPHGPAHQDTAALPGKVPTTKTPALKKAKDPEDGIGLSSMPWQPMGIELEMQPHPKFHLNLESAAVVVRKAFAEAIPTPALAKDATRLGELRDLGHVGSERVQTEARPNWSLHKETDPGPLFELVGPWLRTGDEAEFAVAGSTVLAKTFGGGRYAALHVTIDGRCLLEHNGKGLVALLLIWERFHASISKFVAHRQGATTYGRTIAEKSPELLTYLQERWQSDRSNETLDEGFARLAGRMRGPSGILSGLARRDGYRNFAVNVCHLLKVNCCQDCDKNKPPKHGGIEFRVFDVAYGSKLRSIFSLVQRLVQVSCTAHLSLVHRHASEFLLLVKGAKPTEDLGILLSFLEMEYSDFVKVHGSHA